MIEKRIVNNKTSLVMQSLPNELKLYIYRMIHEEYTKKLVSEYENVTYIDSYNELVLKMCIMPKDRVGFGITFNVRDLRVQKHYHRIYNAKTHYVSAVYLPKKYFFTSGMDSLEGYK